MGADDFLVTDSNRDAAAWIDKWPDWPAHGLIVTGHSGSGKTHLLNLWLKKTGGQLISHSLFMSSDTQILMAIHACLAIDNGDDFAGSAEAEEKLFHLYNHLKDSKGSLLITMKSGAGQAGFMLPDLRSRLLALPAVSLGAPDDTLLAALIVKQFRDRQVALDIGVVDYLSSRIARDAASIRDLVERLDHASLAEGRKITIALARKILEQNDG
jgi:chromosomal replication initiation ATPase DnaA